MFVLARLRRQHETHVQVTVLVILLGPVAASPSCYVRGLVEA